MARQHVTASRPSAWRLSAQEVAHALPVLHAAHPGLRAAPAPRLALIRQLAVRRRVRDGALRTALSRACASGALEVTDGRYRLGPVSQEQAAAARALRARTPGYALGVVLEGQRAHLPSLRALFRRLGFRPLQRSVWVGARTADDQLSAALQREGLGGSVFVFQADEVAADARASLAKLWGLTRRAAELRRFHARLFAYLDAPGLNEREAAWRCVEVAPVWYRVAVRDEPPFPLDLCGADYPLAALDAAWRAHLTALTRALRELWRSEEP